MEKAPSQTPILETLAGPVTPLPLGMGIELTWRIIG
jgi:dihydroorotase